MTVGERYRNLLTSRTVIVKAVNGESITLLDTESGNRYTITRHEFEAQHRPSRAKLTNFNTGPR